MPAINMGMLGPAWKETGTAGNQQFAGNSPVVAKYRNGETTLNINPGRPCYLAYAGNSFDGVDVVRASSANTANSNNKLFVGVSVSPSATPNQAGISPGGIVDVAIHGAVAAAVIILSTRATSTDAFASFGGITVGDVLNPEVTNDGLSRSGAGNISGLIIAGQSIPTFATQLSSFTSSGMTTTATAVYTTGKVFIRLM